MFLLFLLSGGYGEKEIGALLEPIISGWDRVWSYLDTPSLLLSGSGINKI